MTNEKYERIRKATHHLSASDLKSFPDTTKFWGMATRSMTYDSGYGRNGQADMTTSQYWEIYSFDTDEALEAWVLERVERRDTYKVVRVEPVKTEIKTVFSIQK